jgi:hypothetical protein
MHIYILNLRNLTSCIGHCNLNLALVYKRFMYFPCVIFLLLVPLLYVKVVKNVLYFEHFADATLGIHKFS